MPKDTPHILLVNPWIHDFAAYDFWAKPLGLLSLASILRDHGFRVSYIDCLNRFHPRAPMTDPHARDGRGPYLKKQIPKPRGLENIPRNYCQYGIRENWFLDDLLALPKPDLILVTSLMTYWYPGIRNTITLIREAFSDSIPIFLGGIYATLCHPHAEACLDADKVIPGSAEGAILDIASSATGFPVTKKIKPGDLDAYPYPAFDMQTKTNYIPILSARGCPFSCAYCAAKFLNPAYKTRNPDRVVEEIQYWHRQNGVRHFVFYDDALLVHTQSHAVPLLEGIIRAGLDICFHTPNALHIRGISKQIAELMFRAGFKTLRLGLETAAFGKRDGLDEKVTEQEFRRAVLNLKDAGFQTNQIGAYLLSGLPGQSPEVVKKSIKIVNQNHITPVLAHYSPIPGTALWERAVASSRYDLASDPVFTNNAILPCQQAPFSWASISELKHLAARNDQNRI